MRLFQNANFPFLQWRRRAYIVSSVLILVGIGAMVLNYARTGSWLNYGVDFAGGALVQIDFDRSTSVEELRGAARSAGSADWEITRFGASDRSFVIRMESYEQEAGRDASSRVSQALQSRFQADDFRVVRTEAVGPRAGADLQNRALLAIVVSFVATLIYLAIRFEWRFGLAAIVATLHDILITLGFLAVTRGEVSLGTVAALLTIVGYSLNDTIVVFDRIRENLAKTIRVPDYLTFLNRSVNETLPRTVLTGPASLATLLALYVFGGAVIRDFALVLIIGIVVGTLSSIFVAAPVLYEINRRWPRQTKAPNRSGAAAPRRSGATV